MSSNTSTVLLTQEKAIVDGKRVKVPASYPIEQALLPKLAFINLKTSS